MKYNEVVLKKIDLRQTVRLHTTHNPLRLTHTALPPPKKLTRHTFRMELSPSPHKRTYNWLNQKSKGQYMHKSESELSKRYFREQDKTYNNNYKLFPKRGFLRSAYVVQNTNIVIDVFSKKIQFQRRKHDFLARTLSLQLSATPGRTNTLSKNSTPIHHKLHQAKNKTEDKASKQRQGRRAQSAREGRGVVGIRGDGFTPWQVEVAEYAQQMHRV